MKRRSNSKLTQELRNRRAKLARLVSGWQQFPPEQLASVERELGDFFQETRDSCQRAKTRDRFLGEIYSYQTLVFYAHWFHTANWPSYEAHRLARLVQITGLGPMQLNKLSEERISWLLKLPAKRAFELYWDITQRTGQAIGQET